MKSKKWIWIGIAVVVVALLITVGFMRQVQGRTVAVQLAKVRLEDVSSRVRAPGKIEPKTQVKVSADIPGKVLHLLVKEGDRVRKGQLMLQIDDTQYRAMADQARAALASGQAQLTQANASLTVAKSNFARQRALFDQKLLSQSDWDQATTAFESARTAQAAAAEEVTRARAALNGAVDNVQKCHFEAPFDGVVSALNVEQGEIVITGTMNNPGTQILTVSDLSRMLVRADVDETDVVDVKLGQKAKITVDALPDTSFTGTVTEIGNTAKLSATGVEGQTNFEVKVVFDHDVPQVRPGMTADVEIETGTHAHTRAVPIQAVVVRTQSELDRATKKGKATKAKPGDALAADEDTVGKREKEITGLFKVVNGTTKFVPVRTGIASETMIEVFGDVKDGDEIVTGPYKALRELKPDQKVKKEGVNGKGKK